MRILIVKTSSLGDVVHTLPMASDLAAHDPRMRIDWVVEETFADIPRLHAAVSTVIPVALRRWRRAPWAMHSWRELRAARAALRAAHYDLVLDCQGLLKSAWVARWARAPVAGLDRASAREPLASRFYTRRYAVARDGHAIERNRRLAGLALGYAPQGAPRFGLRVPPPDGALAPPLVGGPYAVLLTHASRPGKRWPDERWVAIGRQLAGRGVRSLLVWGTAEERHRSQALAVQWPQATVAPRLPLAALATVLAQARVVVGLDTGLSHLAAAVGVPTVGIYCDYDPRLTGIVGVGACASVGSADAPPPLADVAIAVERVLTASEPPQ